MIPVDGADAVASAPAGIVGYLPRQAALMGTATALLGTAHGIALRAASRQERAEVVETGR